MKDELKKKIKCNKQTYEWNYSKQSISKNNNFILHIHEGEKKGVLSEELKAKRDALSKKQLRKQKGFKKMLVENGK